MESDFQANGAESTRLTLSSCTVDLSTTPSSVIVIVTGELDMADADQVGELLTEAAAAGKPVLRVDLAGLTFADSSAVKSILLGAKAAEDHGVAYEIVNPHGSVRRLLNVSGLIDALSVVDETVSVEGPNSS